jgi:hypothetical protein
MDGHPPQANLVERKMIHSREETNSKLGSCLKNKMVRVPASLTNNDNSLEMENCNYDLDKHSLIDDNNEFLPDDLSDLDPTFVMDVCESLKDH